MLKLPGFRSGSETFNGAAPVKSSSSSSSSAREQVSITLVVFLSGFFGNCA